MKSNSSLPEKRTLADSAARQCEGSDRINYGMIPLEDLDWAADQKPAVFRLFTDCWRSDPYGTRWMPLTTKLKDKALKQAKAALRQKGLFDFESKMRILENRRYYETFVINLHGSRRDSFWHPGGVVNDPTKNQEAHFSPPGGVVNDPTKNQEAHFSPPGGVVNDPTKNQEAHFSPPGGVVNDPTSDSGGVNNDPRWGGIEPQVGSSKTPGGVVNDPTNSPQTQSQSGLQTRSGSFHDLKRSKSSSISPRAESGEEEFKIQEKREEATQDSAIRPEGTSKPETVVEPEGICTPESLASLIDKSEIVAQPKDLDRDECSAAPRENENQSHRTESAALLKWLVEVKLPAMELNDPPRNLEAYAKAMIRRDGDALREEFAEVVRDRQFREECAALTEELSARVDEWRQAGVTVTVFFDFDGRPQVRLDGATIAAKEFLDKPISSISTKPNPAFINPDHAQNRKARQSRLKCADKLGECPGLEFLEECWQDVLLQPQIKQAIKKHPHWGICVNDQHQLEQFGSPAPLDCIPQADLPSDSEVAFPQPQEIQMSAELHPGDYEYQYLMHLSQIENGAS